MDYQRNTYLHHKDFASANVELSAAVERWRMRDILVPNGELVCLLKPQFEVGKGGTVKGIVKDSIKREAAKERIISFAKDLGLEFKGEIESPIKGAKGNIEYLLYFVKI